MYFFNNEKVIGTSFRVVTIPCWISIVRNREMQRTHKNLHVLTVYLTQKNSVWTRTYLDLFFTRTFFYQLIFVPKPQSGTSSRLSWGSRKPHHRKDCAHTYEELKEGLPITFDKKLPIAYARKASDHCLRFLDGNRYGLTDVALEYVVKKYKSHRREVLQGKKSQMTLKCCKKIQPSSDVHCSY